MFEHCTMCQAYMTQRILLDVPEQGRTMKHLLCMVFPGLQLQPVSNRSVIPRELLQAENCLGHSKNRQVQKFCSNRSTKTGVLY